MKNFRIAITTLKTAFVARRVFLHSLRNVEKLGLDWTEREFLLKKRYFKISISMTSVDITPASNDALNKICRLILNEKSSDAFTSTAGNSQQEMYSILNHLSSRAITFLQP